MDQHQTAKFGNSLSFGKWNQNLLTPELSFKYFFHNGSRPPSMCLDNSFDFSSQLRALNLQVIDIEQSCEMESNETYPHANLKIKIKSLSKKIAQLSQEIKKIKQDQIDIVQKINWEGLMREFTKIIAQKINRKGQIQYAYCQSREDKQNINDSSIELQTMREQKQKQEKQIKKLQAEIHVMESMFIKKQLQRKKQLEAKQIQWKNKIDAILLQISQENSCRTSNGGDKQKSFIFESFKNSIRTNCSNINRSEVQSATLRRKKYHGDRSLDPEASYTCLHSRIKIIQNLLKKDIQKLN